VRILVTGGAGYVGSHCVRALCDAGHVVGVLDNLSTGHREAVDLRATLIVGNLGDGDCLDRAFRDGRFEAVMHFAAFLDVGESVRRPLEYYRNNVCNTVLLLERMQAHGIRKLVFSSTCAVYGVPPLVPIREEMPKSPINPYGRTKLAIEWALEDGTTAWGLGATALRYFNAAGAAADASLGEDHEPEIHLIPLTLQTALGIRPRLKIFGTDYPTRDGTCIRDYVHVEDLAAAHLAAVETQNQGEFRFYNLGTGRGASVLEVIRTAREVTGKEIPADPAPRREGDPPELWADAGKAMTELGWKPTYTSLRSVIESAWNWHRRRPRGYTAPG
jgi:UDP-glucose-4-epimerase GalE